MWKQRKIIFSHVANAASQESHSRSNPLELADKRFRLLLGEINERKRGMPVKCSLVDVPRQESGAFWDEIKLNWCSDAHWGMPDDETQRSCDAIVSSGYGSLFDRRRAGTRATCGQLKVKIESEMEFLFQCSSTSLNCDDGDGSCATLHNEALRLCWSTRRWSKRSSVRQLERNMFDWKIISFSAFSVLFPLGNAFH